MKTKLEELQKAGDKPLDLWHQQINPRSPEDEEQTRELWKALDKP